MPRAEGGVNVQNECEGLQTVLRELRKYQNDGALNLQESTVYQFHSMLILHPPPMLIPPIPPEAAPVDEGIAIAAVAVGLMPDIGIDIELIISWFMAMVMRWRVSGLDC